MVKRDRDREGEILPRSVCARVEAEGGGHGRDEAGGMSGQRNESRAKYRHARILE